MSRDQQRERDKALRLIAETVGEMGLPPELAAYRVLETVLSERRLWRRYLRRRFHMQVVNTDGCDHLVGIKKVQLAPRHVILEEWIFLHALQQHALWELSYRVMIQRSVKALDELEGWHWSDDAAGYLSERSIKGRKTGKQKKIWTGN